MCNTGTRQAAFHREASGQVSGGERTCTIGGEFSNLCQSLGLLKARCYPYVLFIIQCCFIGDKTAPAKYPVRVEVPSHLVVQAEVPVYLERAASI